MTIETEIGARRMLSGRAKHPVCLLILDGFGINENQEAKR